MGVKLASPRNAGVSVWLIATVILTILAFTYGVSLVFHYGLVIAFILSNPS